MTDQKTFSIQDFELRKQFQDAMIHGHYLITITKHMGNRMDHYTSYQAFPLEDILPALQHVGNKLLKDVYRIPDSESTSGEQKTVTHIKQPEPAPAPESGTDKEPAE